MEIASPMPRVPPVTTATRAITRPPSALVLLSLHAHRDAHAAADAERGEALLGIAPLHLVQQRHQHARTGSADRMAERDRAAVDVDLGGIPAEVLVDGASLCGKGLVGLDEIEVLDLPAGFA